MPQTVTSALFMVLFKKSKSVFENWAKMVHMWPYLGALSNMCVLPQLIIKYFEDIGQIFVQNPSVEMVHHHKNDNLCQLATLNGVSSYSQSVNLEYGQISTDWHFWHYLSSSSSFNTCPSPYFWFQEEKNNKSKMKKTWLTFSQMGRNRWKEDERICFVKDISRNYLLFLLFCVTDFSVMANKISFDLTTNTERVNE